jgi:GGDEF domain-containing protein
MKAWFDRSDEPRIDAPPVRDEAFVESDTHRPPDLPPDDDPLSRRPRPPVQELLTRIDPLEGLEPEQYPWYALRRGRAALLLLATASAADDPLAAATISFARRHGIDADAASLLAAWANRRTSPVDPGQAYPWRMPFDAEAGSPDYAREHSSRRVHWRPGEADWLQRDPTGYGRRIFLPLAIAESVDLLAELSDGAGAVGDTAKRVLAELMPAVEADVATFIQAGDAWRDTIALWALVRRPRALALLHPLAVGIATRYATLATRTAGLVCATQYPFAPRPLVSASAQLASALWTLGVHGRLVPGVLAHIALTESATGGWHDPGQPDDVLTTLVAADLLTTLDPSFDPTPTIAFLARAQERPAGWWRALDPEVPWLTSAIVEWLETATTPFADRFRWPALQAWDRDRKTRIGGFAHFSALARAFADVPTLAAAPLSLAFCDLIRFREFNNARGQEEGDRLLRRFAEVLDSVPRARPIRDGGDEFLVIGAPTGGSLVDSLSELLARWRTVVAAEFPGAPPVAPRIVVAATTGGRLLASREQLGRAIGRAKDLREAIEGGGILLELPPA